MTAASMDNDKMPGVPGRGCELGREGCDGSHGPLTEFAHEGFVLWKSEDNVIRHRKNTGIPKRKKQKNGTVAVASSMAKLVLGELRQAGATEASLSVAKRLLTIAATKDSSAAVGALDRLSARLGESWEARKPSATQVCPLCNRKPSGDIHITISEGTQRDMARFQKMIEDDKAAGRYEWDPVRGVNVRKYDDEDE